MDAEALVEYRYRAVLEVLAGSPVGEVAARYGTSRQSLHMWRRRFDQEGRPGLADRSRRPASSPNRLAAQVEALICDLRRQFPRWGARRIRFELRHHGVQAPPSRATVHRVLTRNSLVDTQAQEHKRVYRRWQREAPMHLWQMDLVGGVPLADGRECKMLTGIDDHSRFVVIAAILVIPTGRAVCEAFTAAMRHYGAPFEVLTDNGKQFTGRHSKPLPVEVMFERVCRENGITQRLTKPRSPTTTGKIERFHKTLREELLNHVAPFESLTAAQQAINEWVSAYNHHRPHQALDMDTPASRFRSNGPTRPDHDAAAADQEPQQASAVTVAVIDVPPSPVGSDAVEFEAVVPPTGEINLLQGRQRISLKSGLAGRTLTIWADQRSIHVTLDGHLLRSLPSRLTPQDLNQLRMRGARTAGPAPASPALQPGRPVLAGQAVEVHRRVRKDGYVSINGIVHYIGSRHAADVIVLRLDGHLMHAIAGKALIGTWPSPIPASGLTKLQGARAASTPLPPPPLPTGAIRVQRRVYTSGRIMVATQMLKLGARHAGKTVTVIIEDTHFRILHGEEEIAVKARRDTGPITRLHVKGKGASSSPPSSTS